MNKKVAIAAVGAVGVCVLAGSVDTVKFEKSLGYAHALEKSCARMTQSLMKSPKSFRVEKAVATMGGVEPKVYLSFYAPNSFGADLLGHAECKFSSMWLEPTALAVNDQPVSRTELDYAKMVDDAVKYQPLYKTLFGG